MYVFQCAEQNICTIIFTCIFNKRLHILETRYIKLTISGSKLVYRLIHCIRLNKGGSLTCCRHATSWVQLSNGPTYMRKLSLLYCHAGRSQSFLPFLTVSICHRTIRVLLLSQNCFLENLPFHFPEFRHVVGSTSE